MSRALHITNGDSAAGTMRKSGIGGDVLPWRDVLHEGPVPAHLSLDELSEVRADFLAASGAGERDEIRRDFKNRDDALRRFAEYDEIVLWFEWDLYDQLQLIQVLDFFAGISENGQGQTRFMLSIVSHAGYLGKLEPDAFDSLFISREPVTAEMLSLARSAWGSFRDSDPTSLETVAGGDTSALPFLGAALRRALEEFPSTANGLSRSESQILESLENGERRFNEVFASVSGREERVFCGDSTMAGYIERMSNCETPLITYRAGDRTVAPESSHDSPAFRFANFDLTDTGRQILACQADWIALGGSDRWIGGVHLDRGSARWRWDSEESTLREIRIDAT